MSERLKYEGRLLEYRQQARQLKLRAEGLRDAIRDCLDPFEKIEQLKAERISQQAMELWGVVETYREILDEIARIEKELGICE